MSQAELLALVVSVLESLNIAYMLVGSHASSFYGEARSTHDVDLVVDLHPNKIPLLVASFDSSRYYLSESALREGRMANLIDTQTGDKVDCFMLTTDAASRTAFARRRKQSIMGIDVAIASAEDTIIAKLQWSESAGGSSRQLNDIREILRFQSDNLDFDYLRKQAHEFAISDALEKVLDHDS